MNPFSRPDELQNAINSVISEAFDKPYKWRKTMDSEDMLIYSFRTNNKLDYKVTIENSDVYYAWEINFVTRGSYGPTGEGDAFRILATVIDCIKDFIDSRNPDRFIFTADGSERKSDAPSSRQKLYDRMVQRFAKSIDYKLQIDTYEDDKLYKFINKMAQDHGF